VIALHNEQLLLAAHATVAAGSLRSPAAFFMIAPQQNCGRYADSPHRNCTHAQDSYDP
jgi:hypothetical protein